MKGVQYKKSMTLSDKTIYVGRPTMYGNPFKVDKQYCKVCGQRMAVDKFVLWLEGKFNTVRPELNKKRIKLLENIPLLRGYDLACWCQIDTPCHRDILLKMANK